MNRNLSEVTRRWYFEGGFRLFYHQLYYLFPWEMEQCLSMRTILWNVGNSRYNRDSHWLTDLVGEISNMRWRAKKEKKKRKEDDAGKTMNYRIFRYFTPRIGMAGRSERLKFINKKMKFLNEANETETAEEVGKVYSSNKYKGMRLDVKRNHFFLYGLRLRLVHYLLWSFTLLPFGLAV